MDTALIHTTSNKHFFNSFGKQTNQCHILGATLGLEILHQDIMSLTFLAIILNMVKKGQSSKQEKYMSL